VPARLGLAKLRASGHLAEVGADKLRFTRRKRGASSSSFVPVPMTPEDVAFLHARSEGWPAALQLAVLALGDSPERTGRLREFGGTLAEVADYLAAEVLARLPGGSARIRAGTSVLGSFCAELAEAVTGMPDGAGFIERLARANLFLVSLDTERRWFRYHAMAREFMSNRLERTRPIASRRSMAAPLAGSRRTAGRPRRWSTRCVRAMRRSRREPWSSAARRSCTRAASRRCSAGPREFRRSSSPRTRRCHFQAALANVGRAPQRRKRGA
jgi:LuxR family maltose regulon positive regulatory protein